ncbi:cytochrome c biogenesis protein CcdA, partial [Nostoc sp. NIES-2111]
DNPLASGSLTPQSAPVQQASVVPAAAASGEGSRSLWMWFWVAFGSGLLALLTPCVYPMVPMTVSFFTRQGQTRAKGLGLAATFGLSIVALYVLIGVIVSRLFGGDVANEIATHWLPNTLFFIIFVTFGFSFLGYFEITLPSSWSTAADERAEKGGIVGVFFVALTLVIVSFSCTGPIASGILIESARGAVVQPVVAMLGFSLAFALPFSLFAAFPHAMQSLPRSGTWMNSVKVALGFLELALALKFLSVADLAYHWHLLDREVYLALWIVIFTLLGFYLLGKLRFPHDSPEERPVGWPGLVLAISSFAFVVYLVPGMWGAPLRALSGYLPPLETQDFRPSAVPTSSGSDHSATTPTAGCPAPRYADFLHLPHGLPGYFDLNQALACAKVTGKPVFIDFTGHGCTNCREMEARVWSQPEVLNRLRDKFTVCALYVDDRTELPADEQYTSKVDGKLKANIGKRNLDMQVERFNSNAQPQYVILSPDGEVLAGPHAYDLDVPTFVNFLDAGLAKAKAL